LTAKRLPKDQRRAQLLETAAEIVGAEGTDALTLAYLAERAGVTKPIAYEHFGTRAGLLIALYRRLDERQAQAVRAALAARAQTLDQTIEILSSAYVDCVLTMGPSFGAISDALSASEEMDDFRSELRDGYVRAYGEALAPFLDLPKRRRDVLLHGILGAADALSTAAASGRMARDDAVDALARIMKGALAGG
jgi:AcrR family transcriptional regulator